MVYCSKCGAKNEDEAENCVKCGEPLYPKRVARKREETCFGPRRERHVEEECFGLPYGGAIIGLIIGIIIIVVGITMLMPGVGMERTWEYLGPTLAIIVGVLIIAGVMYRYSTRG